MITLFILIEVLFSTEHHFILTEMGNKTSRKSKREQIEQKSAVEADASQGNETMDDSLSYFDNFSSVRDGIACLLVATQTENEMQVRTQTMADKTNKEMYGLR